MPSRTEADTLGLLAAQVADLTDEVSRLRTYLEHALDAPTPSRLLSVDDVAARLDVSRRTVYALFGNGSLRRQNVGRSVKVAEADVDAFIARRRGKR